MKFIKIIIFVLVLWFGISLYFEVSDTKKFDGTIKTLTKYKEMNGFYPDSYLGEIKEAKNIKGYKYKTTKDKQEFRIAFYNAKNKEYHYCSQKEMCREEGFKHVWGKWYVSKAKKQVVAKKPSKNTKIAQKGSKKLQKRS